MFIGLWMGIDRVNEAKQNLKDTQAKSVLVYEADLEPLEMTRKIPGRVLAYRTAEIRPQVSGIILERLFKEGSYVEEGEQLYQIDPDRYEADYEMAQAKVQTAQAELTRTEILKERYARLIDAKGVSAQEYDNVRAQTAQAQAALALAQAELRSAQINLNYTKVYAPISGYIGPSSVTKGALVSERQEVPLAVIRQLDQVYVDLSKPGSESRKLTEKLIQARGLDSAQKRYEVTLFLHNLGLAYEHKGYLDAAEQAIDERTGSLRLRSVFPNPDIVLLPGMFVQATIANVGEQRAILVPHKSVMIQPSGEKAVWVVQKDQTVQQRIIQAEQSIGNKWLVREGLNEGELVVTEGAMHLGPGDKVIIETSQGNETQDSL